MSKSDAGKGDRPRKVDRKKWDATWARINQERDNECPKSSKELHKA